MYNMINSCIQRVYNGKNWMMNEVRWQLIEIESSNNNNNTIAEHIRVRLAPMQTTRHTYTCSTYYDEWEWAEKDAERRRAA